MKDTEMNAKLQQAFSHAVPDILDSVLSDCKEQKGQVILLTETKKNNRWVKYAAGLAACLMVVLGGTFGLHSYHMNYSVGSTVSLDVNPSIQITVNKKERVLDVKPLNEDGKIVLGDMDFSGNDIDVTVNALIGSMLRNGYLTELANSILISVDNSDPEKGAALQEHLAQQVNAMLETNGFTGAVLSQTISDDDGLQQMAGQYGITVGKAQLIQKILENDARHTFEELVPLSINELNLIIASRPSVQLEAVASMGSASDKAYIGEAKAKKAAFSHAGVSESDVTGCEVDMDTEQGVLVYEVEFQCGGYEYDYDVDAVTGGILKHNKERDDDDDDSDDERGSVSSSGDYIGEAAAKKKALAHAGVSAGEITGYKIELDRDDGAASYEIEFRCGGYEYDYDVDAVTGSILKHNKERDDDDDDDSDDERGSGGSSGDYIGEAAAKKKALAHAGVSAGEITGYKIELDRDDGAASYEIEFRCGGCEYDYDVDAVTGDILKHNKERDDDDDERGSGSSSGDYIGEASAKKKVLAHAGVSAGEIAGYKIELDRDDGTASYEIEFRCGGYEYEYSVDAATGEILKHEKDQDD